MKQRAAVFSRNPLGDGINMLVLSNNLYLNGFEVDTYQNTVGSLQGWFPHLPIFSYPSIDELPSLLEAYDWYFIVGKDSREFVNRLIEEGKRRFPERVKVIYLYPSENVVNEIYYQDCLTNPHLSVAQNLCVLCEKVIRLPKIVKSNGMLPPKGLEFRKFAKRIVIHPTSGSPDRNWPKEKYIKLALRLKSQGFQPVFVPGPEEIEKWRDLDEIGLETGEFSSLDSLARFIYESGCLVGNDSGLGHLASSLGIETLTFCRRKLLAKLWAPGFARNIALTPSSWIPNVRGYRLRDRHWHKFISVRRASRSLKPLLSGSLSPIGSD